MDYQKIIDQLPYAEPFLFVDELLSVSEEHISGCYTFHKDLYFYQGHFKHTPVTPGAIITECMAQLGLVCFGIFLFEKKQQMHTVSFALSSAAIDFYMPVMPGQKVTVVSKKIYFRFNKLKCDVKMMDPEGKTIAKGILSGMILNDTLK